MAYGMKAYGKKKKGKKAKKVKVHVHVMGDVAPESRYVNLFPFIWRSKIIDLRLRF